MVAVGQSSGGAAGSALSVSVTGINTQQAVGIVVGWEFVG